MDLKKDKLMNRWFKNMNLKFMKEKLSTDDKHIRIYSTSIVTEQIKSIMKLHSHTWNKTQYHIFEDMEK